MDRELAEWLGLKFVSLSVSLEASALGGPYYYVSGTFQPGCFGLK